MNIRRASLDDLKRYWPTFVVPRGKFWLAEEGDEILGIGGYAYRFGQWLAFFEISDVERSTTRGIQVALMTKHVIDEWKKTGRPELWAEHDVSEPTAERWMTYFGFEDQGDGRWRLG